MISGYIFRATMASIDYLSFSRAASHAASAGRVKEGRHLQDNGIHEPLTPMPASRYHTSIYRAYATMHGAGDFDRHEDAPPLVVYYYDAMIEAQEA